MQGELRRSPSATPTARFMPRRYAASPDPRRGLPNVNFAAGVSVSLKMHMSGQGGG